MQLRVLYAKSQQLITSSKKAGHLNSVLKCSWSDEEGSDDGVSPGMYLYLAPLICTHI